MATSLDLFPVTRRWPARHPERLQLYSRPTPNGVKVSIVLEETSLPYEVHRIDFGAEDQKTAEFLALNPNGKIVKNDLAEPLSQAAAERKRVA